MKPKQSSPQQSGAGFDCCQTPSYGVAPLLPYLPPRSRIWEPAAGEGLLADALEAAGHSVIRTDWLTGHDFFHYAPDPATYDLIVTNPPYSIKYPWMERCYQLGKPWALLVPLETIGAAAAQTPMQHFGFEMLLLNRRINFKMPNKGWTGTGSQFPTIWLCWRVLPQQVLFGHIPQRAHHDQLTLLEAA